MTDQEFDKYKKAVEIKDKIYKLENEIEYIEDFRYKTYPRTESGWNLSLILNDSPKRINLTSELFWKCLDLIILLKREELDKYKEEFNKI